MKAVNGLMSIHVVCYLVKKRLLHCFKRLSNGIFTTKSIFYFEFDNFYAEARSKETYTSKLNYEKTKQKKIRKILITNFYLLFSFSKRKINIYMVSKLCNATTALQYL